MRFYIVFLLLIFSGCNSQESCSKWRTEVGFNDKYGTSYGTYIYDRKNFCMDLNSTPITIGCLGNPDIEQNYGVFDDQITILFNKYTEQYVAVNKIAYSEQLETGKGKEWKLYSEWEVNQEAWEELVNHLNNLSEEEKFYPENDKHLPLYPKYCGWEPNTSKEIE
jgi:hypothetical protein